MQTRSSPALPALRTLAKLVRMEAADYMHLSKPNLYKRLKQQYNYDRLQRVQSLEAKRGSKNSRPAAAGADQAQPPSQAEQPMTSRHSKRKRRPSIRDPVKLARTDVLNTVDPIMLTELSAYTYMFTRPNGKQVLYDLESLVDFFLQTGDFVEPETRLPFTDMDLKSIDNMAVEAGLKRSSVYEAKYHPERFMEQQFRRDALLGLERCASELVMEMLDVVETGDMEEGQVKLLMTVFPLFGDMFSQLVAADKEYAQQCMQHWTTFLKGPPNHPTEDDSGFLDIVMTFLKQTSSGAPPFG